MSRNGACPIQRLRESRQHHDVCMESHPLDPTHTKRGKAVVVLQVAERSLNGDTATVEVMEPLRVARDAREQPTAEGKRQGRLILLRALERDDRRVGGLQIS